MTTTPTNNLMALADEMDAMAMNCDVSEEGLCDWLTDRAKRIRALASQAERPLGGEAAVEWKDSKGARLQPKEYACLKDGGFDVSRFRPLVYGDAAPQPAASPQGEHPDDVAVDAFAAAMKAKMAKQRAKGYGGWDDPAGCASDFLRECLLVHVGKGDPVDVGNFAMMLFNRDQPTSISPQVAASGEKT